MTKKKMIIILSIVFTGIALIGIGSYAWFSYYAVSSTNNLLVAGDVKLNLDQGEDTMVLTNVFPESKEEARSHGGNTLTFTVGGTNTSNKSILYSVILNRGDSKNNKTPFNDDELRFDLVEIVNNSEVYLVENKNFNELTDSNIYDNVIPGNTSTVSHTYKIRAWIDDGVTISETETGSHVYTPSEYKDLYATVKLAVKGEIVTGETKTVTFDANGGIVPISTKNVVVGNGYGYLPTPTKEGYTFLGWNGKNLFTGLTKGISLNTSTGIEGTNDKWATSAYIEVDFVNNSSYYLSGLTSSLRSIISAYNANYEYINRTSGSSRTEIALQSSSFSSEASNIKYIRVSQYENNDSTGTINDVDNIQIQLELGNTATEYEPYFITSDTKVVQSNNHTLKAIWQQNN